MKMGHGVDELNNEEVDKWKKNEGDGVDNTTMKKNYKSHQLKIFEKKISAGWGRWRKSE